MATWLQRIVKKAYPSGVPRGTGGHDDGGNNLAPGSSYSIFGPASPCVDCKRKKRVRKKIKPEIGERPGERPFDNV